MPDAVTVEKLYDERLWILTLHENSQVAVDEWEKIVRDYIRHMHSPKRYLIYDVSSIPRISFTAYMRERAIVLAKANPEADGRVAMVADVPAAIRYVFDLFLQYTNRQLQPKITVRVFATRDEALNWVLETLPDTVSNPQPG